MVNGIPSVEFQDRGGYFDLAPTDLAESVRSEIVLALTEMGFDIEASHHEVAQSQHEIDFKYGDALTMADNVVTFKFATKTIALMNGLHATFMAKPVYGICGSGMHINFFAPHFDHLHFQPSDKDIEVFDNINSLKCEHGNDNITDPVHLDLTDPKTWFNAGMPASFSAIFCINIFQVAPVSIADGMMECAEHLLNEDGFLLIYGPFQVEGKFSTDSNQEFHNTLSSAGVPEWGLKDVADLKSAAAKHGLELKEQIDMPANNFSLIFGKI